MIEQKFLNLIVYSDSLAFRRASQPCDLGFTYPFLLKELIENQWGVRVNLLLRGWGGVRINELRHILGRDLGYLRGDSETLTIAVLQLGIVDCAPQPFTYFFASLLGRMPLLGPKLLMILGRYRRTLQIFWSYRPTSPSRFKAEYARMVRMCIGSKFRPIGVGMPLPPLDIEDRSPGFRSSVNYYNELIRSIIPESFCDIEGKLSESSRQQFLMEDGHHLTVQGHRLYAEELFGRLAKLV